METYMYSQVDENGYRRILHLRPDAVGDRLVIDSNPYGNSAACIMPRGAVQDLRDALTAWLCDDSPTTSVTVHLTEEHVRRIVREELGELLRPGIAHLGPHTPAPAPQAGEDVWGEAHPCAACGHAEGVHTILHGCGAVNGEDECWCTSYRQVAPLAGPDCTMCDHPDIDHSPSVGCRRGECGCAQYTSAPAPECTCTHAYFGMHSSEGCTYRKCPCTFTEDAS